MNVMIRYLFLRVCIVSMDDIEDFVIAFMIILIARFMAGYLISRRPYAICSVHNSSLQRNAWLTEMLNKTPY